MNFKPLLVFFFFLGFLSFVNAQTNQVEEILQQASNEYKQGKLDRVISLLSDYAYDQSLSRSTRRNILVLLAESYLYLDDEESATRIYLEIQKIDPFYFPDAKSPEMQYLGEKISTYPYLSVFAYGGLHLLSLPTVREPFSAPEVTVESINYRRDREDPFGWLAGAGCSFNLPGNHLYFSTGYSISTVTFRYNAQLRNALSSDGRRGNATLTFREKHRWSQLPLIIGFSMVPKTKIIRKLLLPYVQAGFIVEKLHNSSAQIIAPAISFPDFDELTSFGIVNIADNRTQWNYQFTAGLGLRVHLRRVFVQTDVDYAISLRPLAEPSKRFSNDLLINTFNYADDNFLLNHVGFTVGVGLYLFKSDLARPLEILSQ